MKLYSKNIYQHLSGSFPLVTAPSDKIKFSRHHIVAQIWKVENTLHSRDSLRIPLLTSFDRHQFAAKESHDLLPTQATHLSSSDHKLMIKRCPTRKRVCERERESLVVAHMNKPHGYISAKLCRPLGLACVQELCERIPLFTHLKASPSYYAAHV